MLGGYLSLVPLSLFLSLYQTHTHTHTHTDTLHHGILLGFLRSDAILSDLTKAL